ncbi:ABC transporter substrate-binding protein [Arcanobacterium phocae]|uniref:Carbohydrate ABC transporter substrate-binding protein, CUT1 family n=1 Tax=Arcanobacterium phocae TaxID=131112 RepID=A0A1H2LIA6_9ACTO|nr:ABC transporter substrate-binding protein [Arcanobacterium phocae]SDU80301.1 carbohydrate ABC transporter substrate-binding protein, CUT1 family [Arcanobacterium phocae]
MQTKKLFALVTVGALLVTSLASCSSSSDDADAKGSVYFLNWKPEAEQTYQKIAKEYEKETGVKVKVATSASGGYEQTLKTEITKSDAPTLFQVNGPVGLKTWSKYAEDISDAPFTKMLKDENLALKGDDGKTYGVPLAIEGYGIIYNQEIMDKYFALSDSKAMNMDEIKNFAVLKDVVEDMQARRGELGIDGVFASTSLAQGEDWRWQTHLSNIPMFYEYQKDKTTDTDAAKFTFNKEFKNIFDLYLNNSTVNKELTPTKTVTDSMAEFAEGKAAMVQNGNWAWSQIKDVAGNTVKEENIKFLPIYTGHEGEDKQGLAVGTEAFMAINAKASEADKKATIDFVNWLFTSQTGKKFVVEDLGFNAPFTSFTETEVPNDPLAKQIAQYTANEDLYAVPWVFTTYPSQKFKDDFGQALAQYATGNQSWDDVVKTFTEGWKAEKK